jgi:hypothetical protein
MVVSRAGRYRSAPALAILALGFVAAGSLDGSETRPEAAGSLPLVLQDDFERGDCASWEFTDPDAWRVTDEDGRRVLDQHRASKYEPAVRSPFNIAVAREGDVSEFVLDVQARSTGRESPRRDLCFIFGYQDTTHFYYAHLARSADEHHNSIFLVDGKPRVAVAESRNQGVAWDEAWHHVRVVRHPTDGLIRVFFDDMKTPVMSAHDKTLTHGRIGLGSFDDTGRFDDVRVWGALVK